MKTLTILSILIFSSLAASAQNTSVYTDLIDTKCKTLESNPDEGGSYKGLCPGVGGYKLEVIEGDLRQTVNVVDPKGKRHELRFWELSSAFSAVGQKAEWRMKGKKPVALIIRYNVSENPEDSSKITSYLIVTKITANSTCVTDFLSPSRTQNADARRAADAPAARTCLNK